MNEMAPKTVVTGSLACAGGEIEEKKGDDATNVVSLTERKERTASEKVFHDDHENIVF